MFNQIDIDALHCKQLQNKEQGNTLEERVDDLIKGWEQKTTVCKFQTFGHEQTVWTNNEDQDSPVSWGHDISCKYMTSHNRIDDDDSTLTLSDNSSTSGESYGSKLYSCRVCVEQRAIYLNTALRSLIWMDRSQILIHCTPI